MVDEVALPVDDLPPLEREVHLGFDAHQGDHLIDPDHHWIAPNPYERPEPPSADNTEPPTPEAPDATLACEELLENSSASPATGHCVSEITPRDSNAGT